MDADELKAQIEDDIGDLITETRRGRPRRIEVVLEDPDRIVEIMEYLTGEGIKHLSTITGRDDGTDVELLYHMLQYGEEQGDGDLGDANMVTVRTFVPKGTPRIDSITDVVPGAALYEREIIDILGVEFEGHPNPDQLLLPDDWGEDEAPPLLKDEEPDEAEVDD
ncbi:MAG TPA: NADH-quinone oxidoreductase subunit C [Natrialbaceae archaeon]|nr:NADH-quinone oxidoreductase subunit C [Natrialbaceae archaeon]